MIVEYCRLLLSVSKKSFIQSFIKLMFPVSVAVLFLSAPGQGFSSDTNTVPEKSSFEAEYRKGVELFNSSDFREAYPVFSALLKQNPSDMNLNFYLGRSAYETEDYETAVFAFDRMLITQPDLHRVRLEMARSYMKLGSYDEAERLFNEVLAASPPHEVQENIHLYLENISASRKNHNFRGSFLAGAAFDSNVYAAPVSETIKIPALDDLPVSIGSAKSDFYYEMAANIGYSYMLPSRQTALAADIQTYHTRYNEYDDLGLDYYVLKAGPMTRFDGFDVEIFGTGSYMNLDQNDYFSGYGFGAGLNVPVWPDRIVFSKITSEKRDFSDLDERDVISTLFSAGIFTPVKGLFDLKTDISYTREDAEAGYYSFNRGSWNLAVSRKLLSWLTASAGYTFESSYYDSDDPSFNRERQDDTHYLRAGISCRFGGTGYQVETGIVNTYARNDSNIDLYEYEKNTVRFFTTVSF